MVRMDIGRVEKWSVIMKTGRWVENREWKGHDGEKAVGKKT